MKYLPAVVGLIFMTSPLAAQTCQDQCYSNHEYCQNVSCQPYQYTFECEMCDIELDHCLDSCYVPPTCETDQCTSCHRPASWVDGDGDGVWDQLEYDLAYRFFPQIFLQWQVPDLDQAYPYLGKAIPYMVQLYPASGICGGDNRCLDIRFGIAYKYDCGDYKIGESTNYCDTSTGFANYGHQGDSEFYAALVRSTTPWSSAQYDAQQWVMIRDFTSAHWEDTGDSSRVGAYGYCPPNCSAWSYDQSSCTSHSQCSWLEGFCSGGMGGDYQPCSQNWDEGSCYFAGGSCRWIPSSCYGPNVTCYSSSPYSSPAQTWAAEGKHALYHSDSECGGGGPFNSDACPGHDYNLRGYISGKLQNIGREAQHGSFDTRIQHPDMCQLYDVWSGNRFANSSDYLRKFRHTFSWGLP